MPRQGTPYEIATQGIGTPDGLGIATQGFIEPIVGDIVTGGEAIVVYIQGYISTGGVITGGAGSWSVTWAYYPTGGLVTGGAAGQNITVSPSVGGDLVSGGQSTWKITRVYNGAGSTTIGGTGATWSTSSSYYPSGGSTVTGGAAADVEYVIGIETGRGGVFSGGRSKRHWEQGITFEPAPRHDEIGPWEYWKRIEQAIEDAKKREAKTFKYEGKGPIAKAVDGKSKIIVIHRDMPDSEVIVKSNYEIDDKIKLQVSRLFNNDLTQDEIIELEDSMILNDLLFRGDYEFTTGDKNRYRYRGKDKNASGEATVGFKPASASVDHHDQGEFIRRKEDEMLILGEGFAEPRDERELEEMILLGFFDD